MLRQPETRLICRMCMQEDWIGLRGLHEKGRVLRFTAPGPHMRFGLQWFDEAVLQPYLAANATQPMALS